MDSAGPDAVPVRATPRVAPCRLVYEAPRVAYASHEQWAELLMAVEAEMSWGVLAVLEEVRQSRPRPGAQNAWTMYDSFLFGLTRLDKVFGPMLARVDRLLLCEEGAQLPREAELWAVRVVHEMLVRFETALNVSVPTAVRLLPIILAGPVFAVNDHTLEHLHEIAVHTVREAMQQEFAMGMGMRTRTNCSSAARSMCSSAEGAASPSQTRASRHAAAAGGHAAAAGGHAAGGHATSAACAATATRIHAQSTARSTGALRAAGARAAESHTTRLSTTGCRKPAARSKAERCSTCASQCAASTTSASTAAVGAAAVSARCAAATSPTLRETSPSAGT
jgi:hypothetical protein